MRSEGTCTDKKENKIFLIIRKSRRERLQSHIRLTASSYNVCLNICTFPHLPFLIYSMTLQPNPSEFPYVWEKNFIFFFISVAKGTGTGTFASQQWVELASYHSPAMRGAAIQRSRGMGTGSRQIICKGHIVGGMYCIIQGTYLIPEKNYEAAPSSSRKFDAKKWWGRFRMVFIINDSGQYDEQFKGNNDELVA
jgi:hypothetical protein